MDVDKLLAQDGIVFHTSYTVKICLVYRHFGAVRGSVQVYFYVCLIDKSGSITFSKSELRSFDAQIRMQGSLSKAKGILNDMSTAEQTLYLLHLD